MDALLWQCSGEARVTGQLALAAGAQGWYLGTSVTVGARYCIVSAKQDDVQEKTGMLLPSAKFHNTHSASGFLILKCRKWEWRFLQDEGNEPGFPHPDRCLGELLTQKDSGKDFTLVALD